MELTRRDFFKATGAMSVALVVTSPTLAAFVDDPRQAAFRMKDRLIRDFQEIKKVFPADYNIDRSKYSWRSTSLGKQWMENLDTFLDHLSNNITGPNETFEEARDEVRMILRGELRDGTKMDIDIMTCTEAAFVVCLVKDCIKNHHLPIIYSKNWKTFARRYTRYVISA